jgi:hypothetical protein
MLRVLGEEVKAFTDWRFGGHRVRVSGYGRGVESPKL